MISTQTRRLLDHFPLPAVMMTGALIAAAGMLHLSLPSRRRQLPHRRPPRADRRRRGHRADLPAELRRRTAGVPDALTGAASGLINASLQIGAAVLLASLVAVMSRTGAMNPLAGYPTALLVGATLPVAAALLAALLPTVAGQNTSLGSQKQKRNAAQ